jgi:protocatechuate 4,5-dioxygenase beta chain
MWFPRERFHQIFDRLPPEIVEHLPYTAKVERENLSIVDDYIERFHNAFAELRAQVQAYKPDVLIMIGDDQGDMFDEANNPIFSIYTGDEPLWGRCWNRQLDLPVEQRDITYFKNHGEMARLLQKGLVKRGFDVANLAKFEPRGNPVRGVSHMVSNLVWEVDPELQIPLICVFINEYYPPLPSAQRCIDLGAAIADVFADRPERVAMYASGGLSHFPGEYNVGWIDEALDHWILEALENNDLDALSNLFTMDSDMMRAGTGEVRAWLSVAAAMKRGAHVVDYVPAHGTVTGCGFAYWEPVETAARSETREAATARV